MHVVTSGKRGEKVFPRKKAGQGRFVISREGKEGIVGERSQSRTESTDGLPLAAGVGQRAEKIHLTQNDFPLAKRE